MIARFPTWNQKLLGRRKPEKGELLEQFFGEWWWLGLPCRIVWIKSSSTTNLATNSANYWPYQEHLGQIDGIKPAHFSYSHYTNYTMFQGSSKLFSPRPKPCLSLWMISPNFAQVFEGSFVRLLVSVNLAIPRAIPSSSYCTKNVCFAIHLAREMHAFTATQTILSKVA